MPKLKYITCVYKSAGGKSDIWQFRHKALPKTIRLPGQPGDACFHQEYAKLLEQIMGAAKEAELLADTRSICWLTDQYQTSDEFGGLSDATRKDYRQYFRHINRLAGDLPFAQLTDRGVLAMRKQFRSERRGASKDPTAGVRMADIFTSVLSSVFTWAYDQRILDHKNPCLGIKKLEKVKNRRGHEPWTEAHIKKALSEAPRDIRDGIVVGLTTGQRITDCLVMTTKQQIGNEVRVRQSKTGTLVDVPIAGQLRELMTRRRGANNPDDSGYLIVRDDGQPFLRDHFQKKLKRFLVSIGFDTITFHGLRYAAAGRLLEAGCSESTVASITGHQTVKMARQYAEKRSKSAEAARIIDDLDDTPH